MRPLSRNIKSRQPNLANHPKDMPPRQPFRHSSLRLNRGSNNAGCRLLPRFSRARRHLSAPHRSRLWSCPSQRPRRSRLPHRHRCRRKRRSSAASKAASLLRPSASRRKSSASHLSPPCSSPTSPGVAVCRQPPRSRATQRSIPTTAGASSHRRRRLPSSRSHRRLRQFPPPPQRSLVSSASPSVRRHLPRYRRHHSRAAVPVVGLFPGSGVRVLSPSHASTKCRRAGPNAWKQADAAP